jgi:hypothetical protein
MPEVVSFLPVDRIRPGLPFRPTGDGVEMLIGQTDGIELLPGTPEVVWGLVSFAMIVALVLAVTALLVGLRRAGRRRDDLESRVGRLEEHVFDERAS